MHFLFYSLLIFGTICLAVILTSLIYIYTIHRHHLSLWSEIQQTLQERYNFIPNLIQTLTPHLKDKPELLESLSKARKEAMRTPLSPSAQSAPETKISILLNKIILYCETLPDLHAETSYYNLLQDLETINEDLRSLRHRYNQISQDLNHKQTHFPFNLITPFFTNQVHPLFQPEEDRSAALATNLDKQG